MLESHKQSLADVLQSRYSLKFRKFHKKTPVLEFVFDKDADLKPNVPVENGISFDLLLFIKSVTSRPLQS